MREPWIKWTFLEAFCRASSSTIQKVFGATALTFGHAVFAATIIGAVQTVAGYIVVRQRNQRLVDTASNVIGAITFGTLAFIATTVGLIVFLMDGEISIYAFIITLSIVPGALIDRIFFKHRLSPRQWLGIVVAVLAAYAVFDCPSLREVLHFPPWVWLTILNTFIVAINQGVTQKISGIDPFAKNFWGGITAVILGLISSWFLPMYHLMASPELIKLALLSLLIGGIVVVMWTFNLLSYKSGAYISLKKLVMNGSYLFLTTIAGLVLFGESFSLCKAGGFILYLVAYLLMTVEKK